MRLRPVSPATIRIGRDHNKMVFLSSNPPHANCGAHVSDSMCMANVRRVEASVAEPYPVGSDMSWVKASTLGPLLASSTFRLTYTQPTPQKFHVLFDDTISPSILFSSSESESHLVGAKLLPMSFRSAYVSPECEHVVWRGKCFHNERT